MAKYKGIKQFKKNQTNPFLEETIAHIEEGKKTLLFTQKDPDSAVNYKTGELLANTVYAKQIKVDKAEFRKVFKTSLPQFTELSSAANKVFQYVLSSTRINDDVILFDFQECMEFTKYKSKYAINNGISELLNKKFIARTNKFYKFYINPTMFFNGDRITFVTQYIKSEKKELKQIEAQQKLKLPPTE